MMSTPFVLLGSSSYVPVPAVVAFLILSTLLLSRSDPDARASVRHVTPLLLLVTAALALAAFAGSPILYPSSFDAGGSSFARAQPVNVGHWRRLCSFLDYWLPGTTLFAVAWVCWPRHRLVAIVVVFLGFCLGLLALAVVVDGYAR
jgi:hypothetical protein